MRISYGGGSRVSVAMNTSGEMPPVRLSTRSSNTFIQQGSGCDVVYFAERDHAAGETRLAAVVVTRRLRRPTEEDRRRLRNRPRVIAAMTAYRVLRVLPSFVRRLVEPRSTSAKYDAGERILRVDGRAYGPMRESETLVVLFDTLSKPRTQTTIQLPVPPIVSAPVLSDSATLSEWSAANREMHRHGTRDLSMWARECVHGVPAVAEFVRESNALAG